MKLRCGIVLAILLSVVCPAVAGDQETPQAVRDWGKEFRETLQENILMFWIDHGIDRQYGGMVGWLDRRGRPIRPGTKSLVQQARVVWSFAAAYRLFPQPQYKEVATHALKFMRERMWDNEHGGYYWLVEQDGRVRDARKHLYGQSFAIYGLAEYALAFADAQARDEALALFRVVDRKAHDAEYGGYHEAFSQQWQRLTADATLGARGRKSMNTHIHLLESFTTLYKATSDRRVRRRVEELLNIFADEIVDSEHGYARLFFTQDWKPSGPDTSSYGHDIQLSWLMTESAEVLGRREDEEVFRASRALVEHTLRVGLNHERGGVYDEGPATGVPESKRMIWWVQAEALVGFVNAYQLFQKPEYWKAFSLQAQYTLDNFVDRRFGEWYNTIEPNGKITGDKASEWKAPYHAARACLEVLRRLEKPR